MSFRNFSRELQEAIDQLTTSHYGSKFSLRKLNFIKTPDAPLSYEIEIKGVCFKSYSKALPTSVSNEPTDINGNPIKDHTSHEVVENTAGGNVFKYCRTCKEEV